MRQRNIFSESICKQHSFSQSTVRAVVAVFHFQGKGWVCKILTFEALRALFKHLCILDHYFLTSLEDMPCLTRMVIQHVGEWVYSSGWQIFKSGYEISLVSNRNPSQRSLEGWRFRRDNRWCLCFLQQKNWISTTSSHASDIFQLSVCISAFRGKKTKHICRETGGTICLLKSVYFLGQSIVLNHDLWFNILQTWNSWSRHCPFMKLHMDGKDMILCTVMTLLT